MSLSRVKKRDGREVLFDKQKIADAVSRAQLAVGEGDVGFANDVADIVELALRRRYSDERAVTAQSNAIPSIEEIQDLVEQALIELGRAAVAKAYILYRDRRARLRAVLEVRSESPRARAPRVQMSSGVEPWSKGRIVMALMNEADLPRDTASEIAARVEQRVFDSGLVRISSALIRELVDNELVEMGLAQALRRQRPVGLPRHDLRRLLMDGDPAVPGDARRGAVAAIGAEILRRYTLDDVLPETLSEMHLAGDLLLENADAPHLTLARALPCELYLRGEPLPRAAFELLDELGRRADDVSSTLVLEDVPALLQCLHKGPRPARFASSWLLSLSALMRVSGKRIDLCLSSAGPLVRAPSQHARGHERAPDDTGSAHIPAWLSRLFEDLHELAASSPGFLSPRVFIDGEDLVRLSSDALSERASVDALLASGTLVPAFGESAQRFVGPGLVRAQSERGVLECFGAVALNLPRAARRAGAWREDQLFEGLAHLLESALDIAVRLRDFQRAHSSGAGRAPARTSFAITPVGLCEALRWLADGELQPEQGGRVLAFLTEAAQRFGAARGVSVVLTPYFGTRARVRFAELDAELYPHVQPSLFEGVEPTAGRRGAPYSEGFDLASHASSAQSLVSGASVLGASTAFVLASQRCGALHPPLSSFASTAGEYPALATWVRLARQRNRLRAGGHPLYALPSARTRERDGVQDELPYERTRVAREHDAGAALAQQGSLPRSAASHAGFESS